MRISFIIPVYKVEKYISQCVDSIAKQTYSDIEVILVDDGSPDKCPALCDEFARRDERVRVLHKDNGGLSDARNAGLKLATGDYVVFVDGDDFWIKNDSLQRLVDISLEYKDLDYIGFNCNYYYPDSNKMVSWVPYEDGLAIPVDKNTATIAFVKSGTFPMSACLKMLKRSFLIDNCLYFKKGQIAEDIPWFINVLDATNKCCFVNEYIYAYRQNVAGSITNSNNKKSFDSLFDIVKTEITRIEQRSFNDLAKDAIRSFLAYEYCILLTYNDIEGDTRRELLGYKDILNYDLNPKVKRATRWYTLFGIRITALVLSVYQNIRKMRK